MNKMKTASYSVLFYIFCILITKCKVTCQENLNSKKIEIRTAASRSISPKSTQQQINTNSITNDLPIKPINQLDTITELYNSTSCIEPPFSCPHPRIQFFLYTRLTQNKPDLLDVTKQESLYSSHFNPKYPVKIIIHGYHGGRNLSPSTDLRNAYFTRGKYNIIIVDYSKLTQTPCLSQLEWAPRFCAMCIAQLVNYLASHPRGVQPDKLHFMGYSAGAHIAGLTSNFVDNGKIGRITGLDPTIIFYMGNNRSRDLDHTDAHFVDIIHTAAGFFGQWGPNGHADFYVNGGTSQPGCVSNSLIRTLSCDHTKVSPYFIESINSDIGFWAKPCSNRFLFNLGLCDSPESEYVLMGEHITHKARGTFYLTTNAKKPFAKGFPKERSSRASNNIFG
ncbi:pancreatic lipase-related protein 2-like [Daktulosphaira vitifoliae]|uniref:pancreatic lipase-related protein 2-like n=1 Tax=Daktulosphaira vitifoliae TaxID=58002 RepID=UPI0021AAE2D2|nr:pancreatic lipase-related protein 2-like [Daktulosphaira vitifoliae]